MSHVFAMFYLLNWRCYVVMFISGVTIINIVLWKGNVKLMPQSSNFGQRHTYTDKLIYTLSTRIWRIGPRLLLMRMWIYSWRNVKPQQPYQHKCINQGMMDLKCNIVLSFVVYPNLQNYLPNITPFVLKSFIFSRIYNLSNIDNLGERKWYNLLSARINEQTSRYGLKRIL